MKKDKEIIVGISLYNGCTLVDFAVATQIFAAPPSGLKPIWLAAEPVITTTETVSVLPNYHFDHHPEIEPINRKRYLPAAVSLLLSILRWILY